MAEFMPSKKLKRLGDISKIAHHYGLDAQLNILQEECAELIQAVSKYKRDGSSNIFEEMADVYLMMWQIETLLDDSLNSICVPELIERWIDKKICRQLERMEAENVSK